MQLTVAQCVVNDDIYNGTNGVPQIYCGSIAPIVSDVSAFV